MEVKGYVIGLLSALLFGATVPLLKLFVGDAPPLVLGGLLYLGAGLAVLAARLLPALREAGRREASLRRADAWTFAGVVVSGAVAAPLLLLYGLARASGTASSLLLTLEMPLTALLAWAIFREHIGLRAALGMALLLGGAAVIGLEPGPLRGSALGGLAVAAAAACWGIDNNLTQKLSLRDPVAIVRWKGLAGGACMLASGLALGQRLPGARACAAILAIGALGYGASIVLHVRASRALGAARQSAIFASAPLVGALLSIPLLGETPGWRSALSAALMAAGLLTLLREQHGHRHRHEPLEHDHAHVHDEHHRHSHEGLVDEPHAHAHRHQPLEHDHAHLPDAHHRHGHEQPEANAEPHDHGHPHDHDSE